MSSRSCLVVPPVVILVLVIWLIAWSAEAGPEWSLTRSCPVEMYASEPDPCSADAYSDLCRQFGCTECINAQDSCVTRGGVPSPDCHPCVPFAAFNQLAALGIGLILAMAAFSAVHWCMLGRRNAYEPARFSAQGRKGCASVVCIRPWSDPWDPHAPHPDRRGAQSDRTSLLLRPPAAPATAPVTRA